MAMRFRVTNAGRGVSLFLLFAYAAPPHAFAQVSPDALFAAASPAVVKLTIKDEDNRPIGTGSGFVVAAMDPSGKYGFESTVITNYHVIYPAVEIDVLFQNKETGKAWQVLVEDPSVDIAVLTVSSSGNPEQQLKLCEGADPVIGSKVFTIGSPLGLTNTLSEGLVSGFRERDDGSRWMQISAPISPGSSGGPVLSADGCVVGIATATTKDGQNLNFAIPAKEIRQIQIAPRKSRFVAEGASLGHAIEHATTQAAWRFLRLSGRLDEWEAVFNGNCNNELLQRLVSEDDQLALMLTAQCLSENEHKDEVLSMLKRATRAKPGDFAYLAHYQLGSFLFEAELRRPFRVGEDQANSAYEKALPAWIKAKELRPDFAPTRHRLAWAYKVLKRYPEALLEAESVVSLLPRFYSGYVLRGTVWAALGRREEFERDFEQAIALRPNDAEVYNDKASGCRDLRDGDDEDCVAAYLKAVSIDPDNSIAHFNLVSMYAGLGQCDKAFDHYKKAGLGELKVDDSLSQQIIKCRARAKRSP